MSRTFIAIISLAVGVMVSTGWNTARAVSIDVVAAYAPSGSPAASPGWDPYVLNSLAALELGLPSLGDRSTDPGAYLSIGGLISPLEMFHTDFNSWRGLADPNSVYYSLSPVFQGETGNRVHFGLHITGDAETDFALQQLSWALDSDDPNDYFDQQGSFAAANYSNTRVGINYGADGQKGTADDIVYSNGENGANVVDELIYVGVGDGFSVLAGDGMNNQDAIVDNYRDLLTQCPDCLVTFEGRYTLDLPGQPIIASDSVAIHIAPGNGGDFNFDRQITSADKDLLGKTIVAGTNDVLYDLNVDSLVDFTDLELMVHEAANTYFGDADCDGEFNTTDLIDILQAGIYETDSVAMWSTGDFDADGIFDAEDLILALADGGYETGPRLGLAAVPEPASIVLTLVGLAIVALRCRRR